MKYKMFTTDMNTGAEPRLYITVHETIVNKFIDLKFNNIIAIIDIPNLPATVGLSAAMPKESQLFRKWYNDQINIRKYRAVITSPYKFANPVKNRIMYEQKEIMKIYLKHRHYEI